MMVNYIELVLSNHRDFPLNSWHYIVLKTVGV